MQPQVSYQAYFYYILTILFVGLHGTVLNQSHDGTELFASIGGLTSLFLLVTVASLVLTPRIISSSTGQSVLQKRLLIFDVIAYLFVATGSLVLEMLLFDHSLLAASRVFISVMVVGYFASIDNTLERQLHWFRKAEFASTDEFRIIPIARKLSLVMVMTLMVLAIVISLSAFHAFSGSSSENLALAFLLDTFILLGLILGLALRITHSYSRNLQENLNAQKSVLQSIRQGNLQQNVPVMSHDEFGMIAQQMNAMLEHLRNQERIHKTLERIVGPNIMEKLLTTDDETLKKGQQHDVAIMFCDMRDFTKMSEAASTEEVIFFMNTFFSDLSEIVSKHNGIINKFMGDAILAVYGLESDSNPVEDAIRSSLEILEHTQMFTMPDGSHPDMGAGIHFGRVVAGTIGSDQRYEYTFLGDAVNTASRLEGLTKRLGYKIVVSKSAFEKIPDMDTYGEIFMDLGRHRVRGKSEPIHVFGGASQD